jgi:hypothetical protein
MTSMLKIIPCAPGAHIGEQITLGSLKKNLSSGTILTNYFHPDGAGTLEIDLLLINYQGVWLLEVKHWWGKIEADDVHWYQEGRKHHSPLTKIDGKAKVIFSDLTKAGFGKVSVVGLVVLSKGTSALTITDPRKNRVFGLNDDLIQALTGRYLVYSPRSPILKSGQVDQIADALVHKHVDPEYKIVSNYRLVEELTPGEHYLAFEGQHIQVQSRRALIKRYHIEAIQSRQHLEESVRLFKQSMEALAQLSGHPNIVDAYDFFADPDTDDTYWLVLEYVDGGTLRHMLDQGRIFALKEQMDCLIPVADALIHCNSHGILHRNLTPRAIYFTESGRIKVGDFDFARVPTLGYTISQTDKPLVINKYVAPEQQTDPRNADHRADIYSLGAIWYDLALHPGVEEPILISKIDKSDLPDDAKELMKKMLSPRPANRPGSAEEVKEWFELLRD